jgi:hypothetical protein
LAWSILAYGYLSIPEYNYLWAVSPPSFLAGGAPVDRGNAACKSNETASI